MSNYKFQNAGAFAVALAMASPAISAENVSDNQQVIEQLEEAKLMLKDAQEKAEEIIREAQREANDIKASKRSNKSDLSPLAFQNEIVSVEINAGTLEDIVTMIVPATWRVLIDSNDSKLKERRFQFVSTRTREQSLSDLLKPIGLKHQYFFDLKDADGNHSPLIIVSAK